MIIILSLLGQKFITTSVGPDVSKVTKVYWLSTYPEPITYMYIYRSDNVYNIGVNLIPGVYNTHTCLHPDVN